MSDTMAVGIVPGPQHAFINLCWMVMEKCEPLVYTESSQWTWLCPQHWPSALLQGQTSLWQTVLMWLWARDVTQIPKIMYWKLGLQSGNAKRKGH